MGPPVAHLAYGEGRVPLSMDPGLARWHVIAPRDEPALPNPRAAFVQACGDPAGGVPLRDVVDPDDRVCIVTSDGTRPVPNAVLLPWLLDALPVPEERVTVLLGNGTHRANTAEEIAGMFGADVARRLDIRNHDAFDPDANARLGATSSGAPILLDKTYVEADKRIVLGFIEPHFFAGFSGGAKGVAPAVAGIESVLHLHRFDLIAHPSSTWGVLEGNPIQQEIAEMVAPCPPDFLVNVTLNNRKEITGIYAGDCVAAHQAGCTHVRDHAMVEAPQKFPVVVTSNSGFPLDQNLYQTVKGMSAAARIVEDGGWIIVASECRDGVPAHGNFGEMLHDARSAGDLEQSLRSLPETKLDQWEAQIFAAILKRSRVALYSRLDKETVEACMMTPIPGLQRAVEECIREAGQGAPVAVLPEGPVTVPYLA